MLLVCSKHGYMDTLACTVYMPELHATLLYLCLRFVGYAGTCCPSLSGLHYYFVMAILHNLL